MAREVASLQHFFPEWNKAEPYSEIRRSALERAAAAMRENTETWNAERVCSYFHNNGERFSGAMATRNFPLDKMPAEPLIIGNQHNFFKCANNGVAKTNALIQTRISFPSVIKSLCAIR
jgi:5-formyltetrahydrofolate cyclo-ligase